VALDPNLVERAVAEATKRTENLDYFLDRLTSPEWIGPLRERRFFSEPPRQYVDDRGYVRVPGWSASRYLARVAKRSPDLVLEVIASIDTNNERVQEDFVDAALAMPVGQARRVAKRLTVWLGEREHLYYLLPRKAVDLVCRLAADGAVEETIDLLSVLFAPQADSRGHGWRARLGARFSDWEYDQLLRKVVQDALPHAPAEFLAALLQLLTDALTQLSRDESAEPRDDLSRIWRVRVADDSDRGSKVEEALTSAVRDAAVAIRKSQLLADEELVRLLGARPEVLVRRITMHALSQPPEPDLEVVLPYVLDLDELTASEPSPEFRDLLTATSTRLGSTQLGMLVEAIERGPDVDRYRERATRFGERPPTDEEVASYVAFWRIGRLRLLKDALSGDALANYQSLVAKHGEAEIPISWEVHLSWEGSTSPLSAEELADKSDEELLAYLHDWGPEERWGGPSVEGLAQAVAVVAQRNPLRISRLAPQLRGLRPVYVQWLLHGVQEAIREGRSFDWSSLLDLLTWVAAQPHEVVGGRGGGYSDSDPGWVWTRREVAALLERGLNDRGACAMPLQERRRVWEAIAAISEDADPTPDHEEQYGGHNMDPVTLSLNTTRPKGLQAAIAYAVWLYHALTPGDQQPSAAFFVRAPEVPALLEAHLDPARDPSVAVRAVFGRSFANLLALDRGWATAHAASIFPAEDSAVREAAWGSYVLYTPPYNNVLVVLRPVYLRSAELAGSDGRRFDWMNAGPAAKLGEHLATFYWRGVITLDDELLTTYWRNATVTARAHTIDFLGRSAHKAAALIGDVQDRLLAFWAWARQQALPGEGGGELAGFVWWFAADGLPVEWRLRQMTELLQAGVRPQAEFLIADMLSSLAEQHPLAVAQILRLWLEGGEPWTVDGHRGQIEKVLRAAYRAGDPDARRVAEETANWLGAKGFRQFRAVVES
jgi:hypothetical protein